MPLPVQALLSIPEVTSFRPRREGESLAMYIDAALQAAQNLTPQRLEELLEMLLGLDNHDPNPPPDPSDPEPPGDGRGLLASEIDFIRR